MFGNYSKLIGSIVGGVVGLAVGKGFLPAEFNTPEIVSAVTLIVGAVAVYFFPPNVKS